MTKAIGIKMMKTISFFLSTPERDHILDLTVYELDEDKKISKIIFAEEAFFKEGVWEATNGQIIGLSNNVSSNASQVSLPKLSIDFNQMLSPKYLSLTNLYTQSKETFSKYRKNQLSLEFWRKVSATISYFFFSFISYVFLIWTYEGAENRPENLDCNRSGFYSRSESEIIR
ncbi:MAG: hypothetical protein Ct9H300mP3_08590 [Gammaproteobacteria bacterium]|nr:MAG: hypothetical protein Ct9H300mP3_08590 [Gammaproteobacteria bacterium]